MNNLKYIFKGFGYNNLTDFVSTSFNMFFMKKASSWISITVLLGSLRTFINEYMGLDVIVFIAFVFLICAELQTGLKVARKVRGERFKSRKFGRMLLKIGTYVTILTVLYSFTRQIDVPDVYGISINPLVWLYHIVFIGIVFQLVISWFENLGHLGYKETKTLAGIILRKYNKWFEFDGSKDNGEE